MKRSKKLEPVVHLKQKASHEALLKLGEVNSLLQKEQQQLDDLIRYREEYLARFRQEDPMVMNAKKALELRGFLIQLDQAIDAQREQVGRNQQRVKQQQASWLDARSKEQAVNSLVKRYQIIEAQKEAKREQHSTDEHAALQWRKRLQ